MWRALPGRTLDFVCDPRGPVKTRRLCRGGLPNKTRRSRGAGGRGTARMSQQPLMSSFSTLEFHAGHYKGAASLAAEAARSLGDRAAILVNRFIMPEGRVSCRRHALETIVSVWSGWLFLISQRKITARRRTRAKETRSKRQYAKEKKSISSFFFALSSFF